MPDGLYERDALAWAEVQADLLRRLVAGEEVGEQIDWRHVIEEVNDVGLSELRACESFLIQALRHLLKLRAWPDSMAATQWKEETGNFLDDAERSFTPAMRQRIDVANLYCLSLRRVRKLADESGVPVALADQCPFTLDELLQGEVEALLALL